MTTAAEAINIIDGMIDGRTDDLATSLHLVKSVLVKQLGDAVKKEQKIKVRDLPHCEQDIVINLDNNADEQRISTIGGAQVARIIIWKNGKRQVAWFSIGCFEGKAILMIEANLSNGKTTKQKIACHPWLDAGTANDSPEGA